MFPSKKISLLLVSLFLVLGSLFLSGCSPARPLSFLTQVQPSPNLRVTFFDAGQGDAALIITPAGRTILVDGGPGDAVLAKLGKTLPPGQKKIDTMILTHPHADHLEGLIPVLKRYAVGEVYYTGAVHTTDEFFEWLKLIKDKNVPMRLVKKQEVVELDSDVKISFLYPDGDLTAGFVPPRTKGEGDNLNNTSIVFKLIYGQTSFLFVGDAETPVEEYLLKKMAAGEIESLAADVLKAGHHGSRSSTSEQFLNAVRPRAAILSAGRGNDYGHPHLRTLRRLERHNIQIYRTDEAGDIKMTSDGIEIR